MTVKLKSFLIFLICFSFCQLQAKHIIGGDLTYRCLGNDQYEIILKLIRDCADPTGAPFDDPAFVGIFGSDDNLVVEVGQSGILRMAYRNDDTLNEVKSTRCGIIGGDLCIHTTIYKEIINLPFRPGGYLFAYQRCCRNSTITNIEDPLTVGATYTLQITEDALRLCNNSPDLGKYPPIYICADSPINFDFKAKDAEGDSLVYELCYPFSGATQAAPAPTVPSFPPFDIVDFKPPYSLNNMIGGTPALTINKNNGNMIGYAEPLIAQYLVAYCVKEYRHGILLSILQRSFQLNVRVCNSVPEAIFDVQNNNCDFPIKLKILNGSKDNYSPIISWNWEVTQGLNTIYEYSKEPEFTFTSSGDVKITLVIFSKNSCSDTLTKTIHVSPIKLELVPNLTKICKGDTVQLLNNPDPNITYNWSPSTGLSCTTCANPFASPSTSITYKVTAKDGNCTKTLDIPLQVELCIIDSCAITIKKNCLSNGLIEITAFDAFGKVINPTNRQHELFWNVKQGPNNTAISLVNKNPIYLPLGAPFTLISKIYYWPNGRPKTIEYAKICERRIDDEIKTPCPGPCAELNFTLASCEDDYDRDKNLDFPSAICKSVCNIKCEFVIALFDKNGKLVDPSKYNILWSNGQKGAYVTLMGNYYDNLSVEVSDGNCKWYGKYWKKCDQYPKGKINDALNARSEDLGSLRFENLIDIIQDKDFILFNTTGQQLGNNINAVLKQRSGIYFILISDSKVEKMWKFRLIND